MNAEVESLIQGLETWKEEVQQLREFVLDCGLEEEFKWRQPCYSFHGKNVLIIGRFKEHVTVSFFKGVLLKDDAGVLVSPGENSQSVKYLIFKSLKAIIESERLIKDYVFEAIEIEKSGAVIEKKKSENFDFPDELNDAFKSDKKFEEAFTNLTTGRQRGYVLFITGSKNSSTRKNRIEKYKDRILRGFGIHDCVCGHSKRYPTCDGSHKNYEKICE